jgi:hypothetical protein
MISPAKRRRLRRLLAERLKDRRVLALSPFSILTPAGSVDDSTPSISWDASTEANHYDVAISPNVDLSSPVQAFDDVVGTSVTVTTPLDNGTMVDLLCTGGNHHLLPLPRGTTQ